MKEYNMNGWVLEESSFFASRFRRYQKKHPNETAAVMNNLDTYVRTLNAGVKPTLIQAGFIPIAGFTRNSINIELTQRIMCG